MKEGNHSTGMKEMYQFDMSNQMGNINYGVFYNHPGSFVINPYMSTVMGNQINHIYYDNYDNNPENNE